MDRNFPGTARIARMIKVTHVLIRLKSDGMAAAEVQISETETPLHRLETRDLRVCRDARPSVRS